MTDSTHHPALQSWVVSANHPDTDFPIQNLPFAMFERDGNARLGVGIGDSILDATAAFGIGCMKDVMAMPRASRMEVRTRISRLLETHTAGAESLLTPMAGARLLLPCEIGDFSDFYASIHHATNAGKMFRPDNPLLPNYKWLPVGYHGRASSIVVSGTPVRRPLGQTMENPAGQAPAPPSFGPSRRLDYEVEVGAFLGPGNALGESIPPAEAFDHLFGVCLLNDWSARDIQSWEYQPLGPFLAKSFATSISPWVVTMEALEPFRCPPERAPGNGPATAAASANRRQRRVGHHSRSLAAHNAIRAGAAQSRQLCFDVLDAAANGGASCIERLPLEARRSDRQRDGIGTGKGKLTAACWNSRGAGPTR